MSACYQRDASWQNRPNVRTIKKLHRAATSGEPVLAACSSRIMLADAEHESDDYDEMLCRRCFPAARADHDTTKGSNQ